jgi:hypothetical protein
MFTGCSLNIHWMFTGWLPPQVYFEQTFNERPWILYMAAGVKIDVPIKPNVSLNPTSGSPRTRSSSRVKIRLLARGASSLIFTLEADLARGETDVAPTLDADDEDKPVWPSGL